MSVNSSNCYDEMAPYYREYAMKKEAYISAVDAYILRNIPADSHSLIDVGAGDGIRGTAIASTKGIHDLFLCDASAEMVKRCQALGVGSVLHTKAENLPRLQRQFDIVLCLWNVLGHVEDRQSRVQALSKIRESMSDHGRLFLDVNNRHNAGAYGRSRVFWRRLVDGIAPDERRGDTTFTWNVSGKAVSGRGHLFTFKEVCELFQTAGLRIIDNVFVDYLTGTVSKHRTAGQMLFQLGKL